MIKLIILILLVVIASVLVMAALKPKTFRTARSIVIAAPPAKVFPWVSNLKSFNEWNPWAKMDPSAQNSYEGPAEGVGAKMSWVGKTTGTGSMTEIEVQPNALVRFRLDFVAPFKATNTADFTFTPQGAGTHVEWAMYGPAPYFNRIINIVMRCDNMVGQAFEKGLSDLKAMAEK